MLVLSFLFAMATSLSLSRAFSHSVFTTFKFVLWIVLALLLAIFMSNLNLVDTGFENDTERTLMFIMYLLLGSFLFPN